MRSIKINEKREIKCPPAIGIIGGVGPWVDTLLIRKILEQQSLAGPHSDQSALPLLLGQYGCLIADRTRYLESLGDPEPIENPALAAARVGRLLIASGARVLGIPCSTFHAKPIFKRFEDEIGHSACVQVVNMVENTIVDILHAKPVPQKVGILCTNGTWRERIYSEPLRRSGLIPIELDWKEQRKVHQAIYHPEWGLKAVCGTDESYSMTREILSNALVLLCDRGADAVLLGCTELPFALKDAQVPLFDPLNSLAAALVRAYLVDSMPSGMDTATSQASI